MSHRVAALSLYKHALRMSKQFDDLLVQRKVQQTIRELYQSNKEISNPETIDYLITQGNNVVKVFQDVTELPPDIISLFKRKK